MYNMLTRSSCLARMSTAFICCSLAVLLICFGFTFKGEVWRKYETRDFFDLKVFDECFGDVDDHLLDSNMKVVLMVIDAWRLSFLTDPDSPMVFLRNSVSSGRGVAFAASVQTPTVTMPRIVVSVFFLNSQALTSGTVPSFISLVTNFFATANTNDNWVTLAAYSGNRIDFFGDDTWLRLFPNTFAESEGVTSFFVSDFTEVDNNVTRHLKTKLVENDWDVLILHYLGLDHIGHSLGGDSSEMDKKLGEMDAIAQQIFNTVSARSPLLLIVMADHGMTRAGSHGGGSELESRVPMVFLHSTVDIENIETFTEFPEAEQVDLASTLPFFLKTAIPSGSVGMSLVPRLAEYWKLADKTVFSASVQSTVHYSKFIGDPALQRLYNVSGEQRCQEAKAFTAYSRSSEATIISRQAQREIIGSLVQVLGVLAYVGITLLLLGFFVLVLCSLPGYNKSEQSDYASSFNFNHYFVFGLYHLSSYSTSFIEEEHDIWYYTSSTLLIMYLLYFLRSRKSSYATPLYLDVNVRAASVLLLLHRLGVAFSAHTRRRWSMRNLLPPPFIPEFRVRAPQIDYLILDLNPQLLCKWNPFMTTALSLTYVLYRAQQGYVSPLQKKIAHIVSALICWRVFIQVQHGPIICLITAAVVLTLVFSPSLGVMLYFCYLVRPETIPLLLLSFEMGNVLARSPSSPHLYAVLCQTVFFYQGQSSNISSIDIAIGYKGLSSFRAAIVGFQILANFYAAPLAFTLGYVRELDNWQFEDYLCILNATLQLRAVILLSSLVGMITLSEHLFMFSVFAPKLICELLHMTFVLLLTISLYLSNFACQIPNLKIGNVSNR